MHLDERSSIYTSATGSTICDTWGAGKLTINVEPVELSLHGHVPRLPFKQLILDDLNQAGIWDVEWNGEIGGIYFDGLAVRFVVVIHFPAPRIDGITSCGEEI